MVSLRNRRGSAVVETALVLLFFCLIFGITELGRAWMTVNTLQTAAARPRAWRL
jgi:Flp pilus assembly protein TadG